LEGVQKGCCQAQLSTAAAKVQENTCIGVFIPTLEHQYPSLSLSLTVESSKWEMGERNTSTPINTLLAWKGNHANSQ